MRVPEFLIARRGRVMIRGVRTAKTTAAAVAAYAVALPFSANPRPVLAPLTALLVVQLTLYGTLRRGMKRVLSVVVGVLVAVAVSAVVGLTWWSLGLVVGASIVIARLLRLGDDILEVPISAMLVLAVGGSGSAAEGRVKETLIGAVVGMAVGAVVAPPLYVRPASDAVQHLAGVLGETLRRMSAEVRGEYTVDQARAWLDAARDLGRDIVRTDRVLEQAEESLKFNPRAMRRRTAGRSLRSGLDALERACVSLRGVCRTLAERVSSDEPETVYAENVRTVLSDLFADMADAVEAYGGLVGSEVLGPHAEDAPLREALRRAWEDRHRLAELLREGDRRESGAWQLHGALAAQTDRMLRDIDSDARAELRASWPVRQPLRPVEKARSRLRRATPEDVT